MFQILICGGAPAGNYASSNGQTTTVAYGYAVWQRANVFKAFSQKIPLIIRLPLGEGGPR